MLSDIVYQRHKVPSMVFVAKAALKKPLSQVPVRNVIATLERELVLARDYSNIAPIVRLANKTSF